MSLMMIFGFRCVAKSKGCRFVASYGGPKACVCKLFQVNFVKS
jgi:hypothetical protein